MAGGGGGGGGVDVGRGWAPYDGASGEGRTPGLVGGGGGGGGAALGGSAGGSMRQYGSVRSWAHSKTVEVRSVMRGQSSVTSHLHAWYVCSR